MADKSMPTHYDTQPAAQGPPAISIHKEYIMTIPGILKLIEIAVSLLTLICISSWPHFSTSFTGWIGFVCGMAFFLTIPLFVFHLLGLTPRIPSNIPVMLIEFIYYAVFTAFFLIAALVAAAKAQYHASIAAAAFFAFAATAVFAVDTFFQFRAWRSGTSTAQTTSNDAEVGNNVEAQNTVY